MLQRMAKKYKYTGALEFETKEEYNVKIKEAAAAYDEFRPKAHKFRETYLVQIAEELAGEDGKEVDFHLAQLINREQIKEHFRRIKRSEGRDRKGGVDKVMADYDKWEQILRKEIKLPDEVEEGTKLWYDYIQDFIEDTEDITWTMEEYCNSWKKMKEDKASLPGIHTTHMKCLDSATKAAEVISRLALIPLLTGYAPKQ